MRFRNVHKVATYLMVTASLGALAFGGNLNGGITLLVLVAVVISAVLPERRTSSVLWQTVWTVSTFVALGLCIVEFLLQNELVLATVNFLLFLLVNKLFNRRSGRDYLQLYVVTFMMVVAGSVLNIGLSFAAWFVLYIVATTWSLILFHLRREMEENYLIKHSTDSLSERVAVDRILNSRRIVGGQFLVGTSLVSITVFVLAIATFLFFPRLGSSSSFGGRGQEQHLTGFSEQLALGGHGRLRDNPKAVMRVYLKNRPRGLRPTALRWRGTAFDKYEHGRWIRTTASPTPIATRRRNLLQIHRPKHSLPGARSASHHIHRALIQEVFLEPIGTSLLFAADQPLAVDVRSFRGSEKPEFRVGPGGELRANLGHNGARYIVYSDLTRPSRTQLEATPDWGVRADIKAVFVRPEEPPPLSLQILASGITAGARHRLHKVEAVLGYLGRGFRYSRVLRHPGGRDPVELFVLDTRAGHCEYFASSMVLLLRAVGVPARVVTGFSGGTYNDYGGYILVRQGDAHAWVEVWYESIGWVSYDPTPAAGRRSVTAASMWDRLKLFFDSIRMRWHRWVIDYNVNRQVGLFRDMKVGMTRLKRRVGSGLSASPLLGYVGLAVAVGLLGLFFALRQREPVPGELERLAAAKSARLNRPITRLLKGLARCGFRREPGETLRELTDRVDRAVPNLDPRALRVTTLYYRLRYSGRTAAADSVEELNRLIGDLLSALKERQRR
ncbi:MAG: DUF3488 and transglutaminase-like domain-containing protein [bacterium]